MGSTATERCEPSLVLLELTGAERRQLAADDGDEGLAQRTRVLVLAADGAWNPDIAEKVAMTEATVAVGGRGSWPRGWPV